MIDPEEVHRMAEAGIQVPNPMGSAEPPARIGIVRQMRGPVAPPTESDLSQNIPIIAAIIAALE